jgi:hypothetical protein
MYAFSDSQYLFVAMSRLDAPLEPAKADSGHREQTAGVWVQCGCSAVAYNLGNFMRTLAIPKTAQPWSLTSLN